MSTINRLYSVVDSCGRDWLYTEHTFDSYSEHIQLGGDGGLDIVPFSMLDRSLRFHADSYTAEHFDPIH